MKRRKRRKKLHTRKIFLLNSILVVFLFLGIGYSLLSTELTIDGDVTVKEYLQPTLYNVFKKEATTGGLAKEYTGEHQDSIIEEPSKSIYYWYSNNSTEATTIQDKKNVLFAGHCWQMFRTTDTGGVKMIYNGEAENGQCLSTRGNHVGYNKSIYMSLAGNYWYGTDYTYDSDTQLFQVAGTTEQASWNDTTAPNLIGKYTCKNASVDGTCENIYLVESYYNTTYAYAIRISTNSHYSQFGILQFSNKTSSIADGGYMYNTRYQNNSKIMDFTETIFSTTTISTTILYAHNAVWGSPVSDVYNLDSPYQISTTTDYQNLVGEYTFFHNRVNYTSTRVNYIAGVNNTTMYYFELNDSLSHTLADFNYTYTYGDSYTDNGNGTFTINNPTTIYRSDWLNSYSDIGTKKYVCKNAINNTCSDLWYTTSTSETSLKYKKVEINKYSEGFTYNENTGMYTLNNDSVSFWNFEDSTNSTSINNHHYTCWNATGECTTISYIYSIRRAIPYYIDITDGKNIDDAVNEMLYNDDVNTNSSTLKTGIEAWYKKYLLNYSNYLEDVIFCNNRDQYNKETNGWNPNGGNVGVPLVFDNGSSTTNNLNCLNNTDKFSVSNNKAKLTYKVGLMTFAERIKLFKNRSELKTSQKYWLISLGSLAEITYPSVHCVDTDGSPSNDNPGRSNGVRPVISLKPETRYTSGNGSMESPYIVDAEAYHYVYSTSGEKTKGVLVSELGSTYREAQAALNGFNKRVVLNHKIENDRVASSGVTFERNGIIYTLYGEGSTYNDSTGDYNDDSIYYEENKQTLKNAFGEDKCTEYTTPEKYYECTDGNEIGAARASGRVGVEIDRWYCRDFPDGSFHCKLY